MAAVAFLALIVATIFWIIHIIKKNKSDKLINRNREIELEKKN